MPKEKPLELVRIPLSQIKPDPKNAKDHDVGLIIESFKRFGYVNPMVLNSDDFLLAGHGRRKGLLTMQGDGDDPPKNIEAEGNEWIVPVGIGSKFNKQDATAYRLVDNRSTEQGGVDEPQLLKNLMELSKNDGLEATGYDSDDLNYLISLSKNAPSLEELEQQHGTELDKKLFWPEIRVRVSHKVYGVYRTLIKQVAGKDEGEQFEMVVLAAHRQLKNEDISV